jgi:hypothetical protein
VSDTLAERFREGIAPVYREFNEAKDNIERAVARRSGVTGSVNSGASDPAGKTLDVIQIPFRVKA